MKKQTLIICLILMITALCYAMDYDVVKCKDGKMYIGTLVEYDMFDLMRIQIGASIINLRYDDIVSSSRMSGDRVSAILDSLGSDNPDIKFPTYSGNGEVYYNVGINYANIVDYGDRPTKAVLGYDVSVNLSSDMSSRNRRIMGLHYLTKGCAVKNIETHISLSYLQLSFEYSRVQPVTKNCSVNFNAGIAPAFMLRATKTEEVVPIPPKLPTTSSSIMKEMSAFDAGLLLSAGITLSKASLSVHYEYGLSKVNILQDKKNRNSTLTISAGIRL